MKSSEDGYLRMKTSSITETLLLRISGSVQNVFDAMGNYLFCQQCITAALQISKQRLVRQCCVKRTQYQKPVVEMSKENARA